MPKTKQQIEQEFLINRQKRLESVRNTECLPHDFEKKLKSAMGQINFIAYNSVLTEYQLLPDLITETNRIHHWIMAGKSLKEIQNLPEARIPKIKEHLQELFDAGSVDYEHFDETYQLFEKEFKDKQLVQVPDEVIKEKVETYNLPKRNYVPTEEDLLARQKLFEEEKKYILISNSANSGGARIVSYMIHDPKLSKQEIFETGEKLLTNDGKREIAKQVVDTMLNIDIQQILNSNAKEYADNFIDWYNKSMMIFDPSFFNIFHEAMLTFLKPDEITNLENYTKEVYSHLMTKKAGFDLEHNNVSNYVDISKLTVDNLTPAAADKEPGFQGFINTNLISKVQETDPTDIKLGINMQKNLRASVVLHNPELVHDIPTLGDNMWELRGAEDPNAQRPWDKDLGNNIMPIQEAEVQPQEEEKPVEMFEGKPWVSKDPRVTPELRDFTISLYNLMRKNKLDLDSDLSFDLIKKYEEGEAAGQDMFNTKVSWGVAIGDFKAGQAYLHTDYFVSLLDAAKKDQLVFVKPGTLVADAKPIVVGEGGIVSLSDEKSVQAQNDPKANDAQYAEDCLKRSKQIQLNTFKTSTSYIEVLMPEITSEAYKKGVSEASFVAQILAANTESNDNLPQIYKQVYKAGEVTHNIKFKTFSAKESKARSEISKTALQNYTLSAYQSHSIRRGLDELLQNGEITYTEYTSIDKSRDFIDLLFDRGETDDIINANKERAKKYLGRGLDPNDPDYADKLLRAQAEVFNERMEKLLDFDYDHFVNMNDKDFAESYCEYHATMKPISIFRAEYQKLAESNKYINQELGEQVIDKENLYAGMYYGNSTRIRSMADPMYAKIDLNELINLNSDEKEDLCSVLNVAQALDLAEPDIHSQRYMKEFEALWNSTRQEFFHQFQYKMNSTNPNKPLAEAPLFYDEKGAEIKEFNLYDYMKQGKTMYSARQGEPDSLRAFSYDYKTKQIRDLDIAKILKPEIKETIVSNIYSKAESEALKQAKDKIDAAKDNESEQQKQFFKDKSESYGQFLNNSTVITRGLVDFVREAHRKNLSVEKYSDDYAYRIYSDGPRMSYDEFCKKVGVPDNEKISKEDIDHRKALSASAAKTVFRWHEKKFQGSDFEKKTNFNGFSSRVFTTVMLDPGKENLEKNKQAYKTITTGTPEEKKKLIEDRLNELMTRGEKFFGKTYTDEELVENIDELLLVGTAAGMEMTGFNSALEQLKTEGVEINKTVLDKMAQYREKIYQYNNYYNSRIDYIASMYYQYGGEKQYRNQNKVTEFAHDEMDWDFAKSSTGMLEISLNGPLAVGDALKDMLQRGGKKIDAFYSTDGKRIGKDSFEVASKYIDGGELVVFYENDPRPHMLALSNMDTLNPVAETKQIPVDILKKVSAAHFDARLDALDKMEYSPERKAFEEGLLSDQYRLALAMNGGQNLENNPAIQGLAANLITKLIISKMCDKEGMDAEMVKSLISDASVAKSKREMLNSNLPAEIIKQLPNDIDGIMNLGKDELFKTINEANAKLAKAEIKESREKSLNKLANHFETSKTSAEKLKNVLNISSSILTPEFWGMSKDDLSRLGDNTKLTGFSFSRAAVQTMCLAQMLSNKANYSIEDIVDPNKLKAEKLQASKEVSALVLGTNGKELKENAQTLADNLLEGMIKCTDYISEQSRKFNNFDIKELTKPENQKFLAAVSMIKQFNQEYAAAFKNLPKETEMPAKASEYIMKAESLGHVFSNINSAGAFITRSPQDKNEAAIDKTMLSALRSAFMSKLMDQKRSIPGNENKPADELIDQAELKAFYDMPSEYAISDDFMDFCSSIYTSPELHDKLVRCISDGSYTDVLKLDIKEVDGVPKFEFDMKKSLMELNKLPSKAIEKNVQNQIKKNDEKDIELKKDDIPVKGMM